MSFNMQGVGVALITPFNSDKSLDFNALERLLDYQLENKTDYLVLMGTTAEAATLSPQEQQEVVAHVKNYTAGKIPLVLGIGGNNTLQVAELMKNADTNGISAFLSASPAYNKPGQKGIYEHYAHLAKNSPLPIILYNVPGRTSSNIKARTTLQLAQDFSNIIGIKEASGNLEQCMKIISEKPSHFELVSGDDLLTLPLVLLGAKGVISVISNVLAERFNPMVKLALKGEIQGANELQYKLLGVFEDLNKEGNPAGVKAYLAQRKMIQENLRLPLTPVSKKLKEVIALRLKGL